MFFSLKCNIKRLAVRLQLNPFGEITAFPRSLAGFRDGNGPRREKGGEERERKEGKQVLGRDEG